MTKKTSIFCYLSFNNNQSPLLYVFVSKYKFFKEKPWTHDQEYSPHNVISATLHTTECSPLPRKPPLILEVEGEFAPLSCIDWWVLTEQRVPMALWLLQPIHFASLVRGTAVRPGPLETKTRSPASRPSYPFAPPSEPVKERRQTQSHNTCPSPSTTSCRSPTYSHPPALARWRRSRSSRCPSSGGRSRIDRSRHCRPSQLCQASYITTVHIDKVISLNLGSHLHGTLLLSLSVTLHCTETL